MEIHQVWIEVKRDNGTGDVRWIEYLEKPFEEGDAIADAFFVDGGSTYTGSSTTTLTGLLHVTGVLVDYQTAGTTGTATVTNRGKITVPATTKCHVGFAVTAKLETMDFDLSKPPLGSTSGDKTRIATAAFKLSNTGSGFTFSSDADSSTFDAFSQTDTIFEGVTPQYTLPGGTERGSARVAVKHATALPCTLESITPTVDGER